MFEFSSIFFIYYPTKNSRYMIWWTKIQLVTMTTISYFLNAPHPKAPNTIESCPFTNAIFNLKTYYHILKNTYNDSNFIFSLFSSFRRQFKTHHFISLHLHNLRSSIRCNRHKMHNNRLLHKCISLTHINTLFIIYYSSLPSSSEERNTVTLGV